MELQPVDSSLRAKDECNVVAAVVSTVETLGIIGSGRRLAQAALQLICCDDALFLSLGEDGGAQEHRRWDRLLRKTMPEQITEGADNWRQAAPFATR